MGEITIIKLIDMATTTITTIINKLTPQWTAPWWTSTKATITITITTDQQHHTILTTTISTKSPITKYPNNY